MNKQDKCRMCRRTGEKLFLKGDKCFGPSCPVEKRPYAPGQAGPKARNKKMSDYSKQLIEKQKARAVYGISENQMRNLFEKARKKRHSTGTELMKMLESRVDNVVYRIGWASSRNQARQFVVHGLVKLNGRKIKSPSIQLLPEDKLEIKKFDGEEKKGLPQWLKVNAKQAEIVAEPALDETMSGINEQLIIEFYSR